MCGIIGIFHDTKAKEKAKQALAILHNRGKDGSQLVHVGKNAIIGHTLHAIVGHVTQPLVKQDALGEYTVFAANCEIYNWQELNEKYSFGAQNDAQLLQEMFFTFGTKLIDELDGVYALAEVQCGVLTLARDLLGVKPLWYVYNQDTFAFASEKKALEKLGFIDIQEVNPRQILYYHIDKKELVIKKRRFFEYEPEHQNPKEELLQKTEKLLDRAIEKRIPQKKFGLLFSGGIDSTYLAKYFKDKGHEFTCYTAVLDTPNTQPSDLLAAQEVAKEFGLNLKIKRIRQEEIPAYLEKIIPLIEDSNVVKVGVALTFYLACEMAKEDGCKVIFSGLGSEEIFAGYERHKNSANINQECVSGLLKMYERDLYRDDVLTMDNNLELRLPFLDVNLVDFALKIPPKYKIVDERTKVILREIAQDKGIPEKFSFRKKVAAQYGSRIDHALGKLAKKNGSPSKSSYLRSFYPTHNVKLGVLFSSGKDSASAAYIMKQQNYELTCLIHMASKNPDSYMFQTAGTELIDLQAQAMNLPLVVQETHGEKEHELKDLKKALEKAKELHGIQGVVSGALFSTYQRDRIERICDELGLKIFSPLWHKSQEQHLQELVRNNFEIIITAIAADGLDKSWLGKRIDLEIIKKLKEIHGKNGLNIAGEGGELETLAVDGPLFEKRIELVDSDIQEDNEHTARLVLKEARLVEK